VYTNVLTLKHVLRLFGNQIAIFFVTNTSFFAKQKFGWTEQFTPGFSRCCIPELSSKQNAHSAVCTGNELILV